MGALDPWAVVAAAAVVWVSYAWLIRHPQTRKAFVTAATAGAATRTVPLPCQPLVAADHTDLPGTALQLLAVGYRLVWRWRLRSIPLVRPMPFFLGHLRQVLGAALSRCSLWTVSATPACTCSCHLNSPHLPCSFLTNAPYATPCCHTSLPTFSLVPFQPLRCRQGVPPPAPVPGLRGVDAPLRRHLPLLHGKESSCCALRQVYSSSLQPASFLGSLASRTKPPWQQRRPSSAAISSHPAG